MTAALPQGPERSANATSEGNRRLPFTQASVTSAHAKLISASVGEIALVMARSVAHQHLPMSEIASRVVPAVLSGQLLVVEATSKDSGAHAPIAYVIWARVSDEVDQRLRAAPSAQLALTAEEWTSGDHIWIVDMAGDHDVLLQALEKLLTTRFKAEPVTALLPDATGQLRPADLNATG